MQGTATVKVEEKDGTVLSEEDISFVTEIKSNHPAKVTYGLHRTVGLPDYDSAKVNVGIEVYCDPADVDETVRKADAWCSKHLKAKVGPIEEFRRKSRERKRPNKT
jgi:hypothetical protein